MSLLLMALMMIFFLLIPEILMLIVAWLTTQRVNKKGAENGVKGKNISE
jgi:hypothetical protein